MSTENAREAREDEFRQRPRTQSSIQYEPGEVVRVIAGPYADYDGVVESVDYNLQRLRVAVLVFGQSTPVELDFSQVEKSA